MPIPPELQQSFIRLNLVSQSLELVLKNLHECLTLAKENIDEIETYFRSHPSQ